MEHENPGLEGCGITTDDSRLRILSATAGSTAVTGGFIMALGAWSANRERWLRCQYRQVSASTPRPTEAVAWARSLLPNGTNNLLKGLGNRSTHRVQPRLAACVGEESGDRTVPFFLQHGSHRGGNIAQITGAVTDAPRSPAMPTTWTTTPTTSPRCMLRTSTSQDAIHVGHSTGGGEVVHYLARQVSALGCRRPHRSARSRRLDEDGRPTPGPACPRPPSMHLQARSLAGAPFCLFSIATCRPGPLERIQSDRGAFFPR